MKVIKEMHCAKDQQRPLNKNHNITDYSRYAVNQYPQNRSIHEDRSNGNSSFVTYAEKLSYKNDKQDHVRKLILHTPKKPSEDSVDKSTTVPSLLMMNPAQSVQQNESISQQIFDAKRSSNEKYTPQRYTHSNHGDNSISLKWQKLSNSSRERI